MFPGLFIVIDGTDGSGKQTQTALLVERLKKEGYPVKTIDFPQYETKSAGMVENYLEGKYGKQLTAQQASVLFAVDRFDASFAIRTWLAEGAIVVADRYVTANAGHQGTKFKTTEERRSFFDWLLDFEYGTMAIPRPDLNIILGVEPDITAELMKDRVKDIHESDIEHQRLAFQVYQEIAATFPQTKYISCTEGGQMLSRESIAERIWTIVKNAVK